MCGTCGCGQEGPGPRVHGALSGASPAHPEAGAAHDHGPAPLHDHDHGHGGTGHTHPGAREAAHARRIRVERSLLEENAAHAARLAAALRARGIEAVGLLGGPGSGKTALLEATLAGLHDPDREAVVEGDCATDRDARRIAARGARVVQVTTGGLCHLDAHWVGHALERLDLAGVRRLWIENVGNLVCPAPFACGEHRRVLLISVTEGADKPEKHPAMLAAADLLVLSKLDLLPHVDFDVEGCRAAVRRMRPELPVIALSARSGEGLEAWRAWLDAAASGPRASAAPRPGAGGGR